MEKLNGNEWEKLRENIEPMEDSEAKLKSQATSALLVLLVIFLVLGMALGKVLLK